MRRDCTDDGVGIVAASIEGSESEHEMFVILLSMHPCTNTRSQLEYIMRGLKYTKPVFIRRQGSESCLFITSMPKKEFIKRGLLGCMDQATRRGYAKHRLRYG